ncbi:MAG: radical SAM family heme chaperone HemW [Dorea sp.]
MKPLELYIHIPFCMQKCKYCDFLSAPSCAKERYDYVESLCKEIRSYGEFAKAYRVVSIFVGGGTPSILEASQMREIFDAVRDVFFVVNDAEITVEMNPGTVTKEKLQEYKGSGVNRLSIGLQSVNNDELKVLGRIHTYEEFLHTYEMARQEGFENINIDLISAIPYQTVESWRRTLHTVCRLNPEHISAYSLIIEEGTPFYERYGEGKHDDELPNEEDERQMYHDTKEILASYGYQRYEISNYAKEGYECKHNIGYWSRTEYLGIGTGAASLVDNCRWTQEFEQGNWAFGEKERLTVDEQMEEFMFLGLRKIKGVSKEEFTSEFGKHMEEVYSSVLAEMKEEGLLEEAEGYVRLTEAGIDVSNYVMSEFLLN